MRVSILGSLACLLFLVCLCGLSCTKEPTTYNTTDAEQEQNNLLHLNELQVIASHNSYRLRTRDSVTIILNYLYQTGTIPANLNPRGLDYEHLPFDAQMSDYGIRGLEIDVYNDPQGGVFAYRKINEFFNAPTASGIPALDAPGFKVLHIKDIDYNTNYYTFVQSLQALKNWSDAHPNHLPLFINIETKQDGPADNATLAGMGFLPAIPYDASSADALDAEIKSVFGANLDKIITPDKLRGNLPKLNDVVTKHQFPTLGESRGKIAFIIQGNIVPFYKDGHPSLQGRAAFIYADAGTPEAVFLIYNNAVSSKETIKTRVNEGYIIRTRADADTEQARTGDYSDMNAAFESGAQIISTDYYKSDPRGGIDTAWTTYKVRFPNGEIARKNPVSAKHLVVMNALR